MNTQNALQLLRTGRTMLSAIRRYAEHGLALTHEDLERYRKQDREFLHKIDSQDEQDKRKRFEERTRHLRAHEELLNLESVVSSHLMGGPNCG